MEHIEGGLIFSATDLINHLECPHLTHLNIEVALGRENLKPSWSDTTNLVARKGDEHEFHTDGSGAIVPEEIRGTTVNRSTSGRRALTCFSCQNCFSRVIRRDTGNRC